MFGGRKLFVCSLFNNAVSNTGYTASMTVDEMERMWKEIVMA
jgi:hypothetical protein